MWWVHPSQLRREGALLLRGLDSRLTKDLPLDLQRLRCKVVTPYLAKLVLIRICFN